MASFKATNHTDYGKAHARRDATWNHRNGHVDANDVQHVDINCPLCVQEVTDARQRNTPDGWPR